MIVHVLALILAAIDATTRPAPVVLQEGESQVVFTERSPLSELSKLLDRLDIRPTTAAHDYHLDKEPFNVYVPREDAGGKPPGLVVCVEGLPTSSQFYPVWEAHNLIFISPKATILPAGESLGLALDAVYNVQRSRTIDPARIYVMGSYYGQWFGYCTGDVFTGGMYFWNIGASHDLYATVNGVKYMGPATFPKPKREYFQYATTRPQVFGFKPFRDPGHQITHDMIAEGIKQDGFEHLYEFYVESGPIPPPADVDRALKALEAVPPTSQPAVVEKPAGAAPATQPAQTGDFSVVFDQRSPLSDYQKLQARLNRTAQAIGPDYQLADEPFQVYVPPDYDGSVPLGIIVYIVPDGTPDAYGDLMPIFQQHHLIFIGPQNDHLPLGTATGLSLDAVFNLQQRYNIDPSRIYLIGAGETLQPAGWSLSDIFAGDVTIWYFGYFRKIQGLFGYPILPEPPGDLMEKTKSRVHVLAFDTDPSREYFRTHLAEAMTDDGFEHVVSNQVAHADIMRAPWLEEMLKDLESVAPEKPAAAAAPAEPPPSEAQHLLKLAQMYIANQQPDMARDKLNQIIQQYPDDPAAQTAKDMLSQMPGP